MNPFYNLPFQKSIKVIGVALLSMLTGTVSFSQTYNWNNVAIGGGGFVSGIITSKTEQGVMFARTDVGGAYRWDATNSKWIPLLDWTSESETGYQGVESIAMDPQASKNVYMLVGTDYFNSGKTAILRSTDYGNTFSITDVTSQFKAHGNGMGRQNGEKLAVDPNKGSILFCGSRRNGLFKSTNSGVSWSNVTTTGSGTTNDNGISFVLIDPKSATTGNASQTIFFGVSQTSNNFYKSTNGGTSFTPVTGGPALMPQRAVLASDNNMYITYADKEGPWNIGSGQIWKYNTTTGAWTNVSPTLPGMTAGFGGISVDPNNANRLIASTTNLYWTQFPNAYGDRLFLSTNGGTSWTDLVGTGITVNPNGCTWITGKSIHWAGCIEFNPFNTAQAYVISGNGVFVCDNVNAGTTTWKFLSKGLEETVALDIVSITNGPLVSVIGDYDGFVHSDITQYAPIHTPNIGTTTGLAVAALSSSKMVRVGGDATNGGKMFYTTTQGGSWTQTSSINGYKGKLALSANGNTILHCPEGSSTMYRSTNNGGAWSTCNGVSIADAVPVADMVNSNKIYAYNSTSGVMMVSTDGGANFSNSGSPGTGGSKIIRAVPTIEGDIWVPLYYGGLTHSTNSGASFTKLTNVSRCDAVGLGKAAPSTTYPTLYIWGTVSGVTGVFRSIDQGANWVRVNDDAHEYGGPGNGQFVIGDMNVYGRVYMSTVGRGIAYGETTATCTATITTPSTSFCTGGSSVLTASTGSTYKWSNATGLISGATNATYTANAAGSYTVAVTDASGCTASSAATVITVNAIPTATITSTSTSFCAGGSVVLSANTGTGLTYQWSNAAGTIASATNTTYTATAAGTYTVKVTNTATTCSATSAPTTITVNALPTATITSTATSFCTGGSVVLSANTGTGLTYQWSNTAGAIASATNATYTATAAGTYTIKVTNTSNCSATSTGTVITVNALPTATITSTFSSFCTGSSLVLSANTGSGLTYQWSNTAGIISGATAATYTATAASSYTVTVSNGTCSATSAASTITVNALPTATITASATSFCTGGSAALTANTGSGLLYQWSNASGSITNATNSTYSANTGGAYTVTVTNSSKCSTTSATTTITANALPTANITASATSFCTGGSAVLSANTGSGLTYQWLNAAGTIASATNAIYTATAAGTYTVTVTNTSTTCSATSTGTTITVNAIPTASITASATSFCTGGSAVLSANTGSGLTYQWSNTAGTITSATNATYTATAAGTYSVKVTNSATTCSATSAPTTITVTASQTATITSLSNSFCTGGSVLLSANTGTGLTYQWSNTAGTIASATNATYTATAASTYTVTVSSGTCSATSTGKAITVNTLPTASITASVTSFCTGGSAVLSANTGSGLTYQWSNAAGTIASATNATYTATVAGTYTVMVTNSSNCSTTSAPTTITVNALPTATINASATSFCTGGSAVLSANTGTNLTYQWSNTAGTIASATNVTYTAAAAGTYTVKVTNASSCSVTSAPITITVTASITWYLDSDGDGKGDANTTLNSCTQPTGYVSTAGDACPIDPAKIAAGNCGCGNSESSCLDCNGTPNGSAFIDNCSACVGGTTGNTACTTTATKNGTNVNISVSPQPFQTATTITLENMGTIKSITIVNAAGALIEHKQNINATEVILGESLASGMYSVIIYTENEVFTTKIIKF